MPGVFSSKRSFLFDLDGTLVDSSGAHSRAYLTALGERFPAQARSFDYAAVAGRPTRQVFAALGFEDAVAEELTCRKQQLYRAALDAGEVKLYPGANELLARLQKMGRGLYLVTGASGISTQRILDRTGIAPYFAGVISGDDTEAGKPSPEPYLRALSLYGLSAGDCLAVEDGASGVCSAQAAGLDVALIHTNSKIAGAINVRDCAELLELVLG